MAFAGKPRSPRPRQEAPADRKPLHTVEAFRRSRNGISAQPCWNPRVVAPAVAPGSDKPIRKPRERIAREPYGARGGSLFAKHGVAPALVYLLV